MRQFLASVDYDCDGKYTDVFRVDLPEGMTDDVACKKAIELDQMPSVSDPSEWFTVPADKEDRVLLIFNGFPANRHESIRNYAHIKGDIFR